MARTHLDGGDGNDLLVGAADGQDTLSGGAGIDTASFAGSAVDVNVTIQGGAQTINVATGLRVELIDIEALVGSSRNDRLTGSATDNALSGGAGNDWLSGAAGNDTLEGGLGVDSLTGGAGNDLFVFGVGAGSDTVLDFADGDRLSFRGFGSAYDSFAEIVATARSVGDGTQLRLINPDGVGSVTVQLTGVTTASLDANDFLFA